MMVAISFIRWIVALMDRKAVTAWAVCLLHGCDLAADVLGRVRGLGGQAASTAKTLPASPARAASMVVRPSLLLLTCDPEWSRVIFLIGYDPERS
jgi:hypothetical protein